MELNKKKKKNFVLLRSEKHFKDNCLKIKKILALEQVSYGTGFCLFSLSHFSEMWKVF